MKKDKNQLILSLIPFLGSVLFIGIEFFANKRSFREMALSMVPAIIIAFISGVVLGIIGLFSYVITLIISLVLIGVIWNLVFFKSLNKRDKSDRV